MSTCTIVPVDTLCRCLWLFVLESLIGSSLSTLCYNDPATRDTCFRLIHFRPIDLIAPGLCCRLLIRDWIDLIDGDSSSQFESGKLGW